METVLGSESRQLRFSINESTQVAAVRRAASDLASELGFGESGAGQVAIVATEAGTNILKHASHGEMFLRRLQRDGVPGIELLALDRGPGMGNVAGSMLDGASTTGTYGGGLGAMHRLSQEFDIYTAPGKGTVIAMALWANGAAPPPSAFEYGALCQPISGETACGDAWSLADDPTTGLVLLADGLGHGPQAALASEGAAMVLARHHDYPAAALLEEAHEALRGTRGAAVSVARIDTRNGVLQYAGVGNIAAHVYNQDGSGRRQLVSHNGIVGSNLRKVQEFSTPWPAGAILIMHSDGLASRWDLTDYPGIFQCHPRVLAALLYRDFTRGRDDVGIIVVRDHC
ncbi:SpoIIE family protein phosphatase [Massilia sp. CF038]|uniref:SpoIIE family protein phosphatase n=1 Tax=Massilia sp. CF038 TaxID=1881045 RepID=UPI0009120063|nr:SpoIIE family protein phosphatase [Massilia sp. CF038]SHG70908.1 Anti-sigma regulatory factor (Ser/Thr protein kinase) [Massilia sp. CF038]